VFGRTPATLALIRCVTADDSRPENETVTNSSVQ